MRKILVIAKKELSALFNSPLAYLILVITLTIFNIFFFIIIDENREATLRDVFKVIEFMLVFIVPLITMKLFAEEQQNGTMEFLQTTPTTTAAIVLGKYLSSLVFFTLMIAIVPVYALIIDLFGNPDRWPIFTGLIGLWLEGAFFIAIGMLMSSLTQSQTAAALSTYGFLFVLYFSISFMKYLDGMAADVVRAISTWSHSENFALGLVTAPDIVYFVSGCLFFLLLTRLRLENRLWR